MADSLKACANTGMRTFTPNLLACLGALLLSAPAVAQQTINITAPVAYHVCGNGNNGGPGSGDCGVGSYVFDSTQTTGNVVTVNASLSGFNVFGAYIDGSGNLKVEGNLVTINAPGGDLGGIFGGSAGDWSTSSATVTNNRVVFIDGLVFRSIYGGNSYSTNGIAKADGNRVDMSGGNVQNDVYGANVESQYGSGLAENNHVTLSGNAQVVGSAGGAQVVASFATATSNSLTMTGGSVDSILGAYAEGDQNVTTSSYNTVTISGGTVQNFVMGGSAVDKPGIHDAFATHNTVTISGTPNLTTAALYGGDCWGGAGSDCFTGNTLNLKTSNLTVAELHNFEFLNFYLPETATNGMTMLSVGGDANLTDDSGSRSSTVKLFVDGAALPLQIGDQVILIDAGKLAGAPTNTQSVALGTQGATLQYEFGLNVAANQLIATLDKIDIREETKSLSEGYLSSAAMLGQGSSFLIQQGMEAARESIRNTPDNERGLHTFGTFSGGKLRYNTGSHVDAEGFNLVAGLAGILRPEMGEVTLAGFFEYGKGDYTSHNSFASGKIKGRGDTEYKGAGIIGHVDFKDILYLEGSLRGGQAKTHYRSDDLTDATGRGARYDADGGYVGAHLGVGKNWKLGDKDTLDTYVQAIWTHQGKNTVTLSTGERLKFDAIDSERLRVGTRLSHAFLPRLSGYAGLAYDHEFAGEAKAKTNGQKIDAPSLKGGTGMLEVGVTGQPSADRPLTLSFGVQGHAGKREGATASFRLNYAF